MTVFGALDEFGGAGRRDIPRGPVSVLGFGWNFVRLMDFCFGSVEVLRFDESVK